MFPPVRILLLSGDVGMCVLSSRAATQRAIIAQSNGKGGSAFNPAVRPSTAEAWQPPATKPKCKRRRKETCLV